MPDKLTVTIPLTSDHECFIELLTGSGPDVPEDRRHCGDVLTRGFSGYWLCGVERDPTLGWLAFDQYGFAEDAEDLDSDPSAVQLSEAEAAWRAGEELPARFYRLDRAAALRALQYAIERWGVGFIDTTDYGDLDCAVQHALLGDVVYG